MHIYHLPLFLIALDIDYRPALGLSYRTSFFLGAYKPQVPAPGITYTTIRFSTRNKSSSKVEGLSG
jgi:hypothetical protein